MKIYLINKETNEVVREFDNVISWDYNYVLFDNNGNKGKIYCSDDEYFTNELNEEV